MEKLTKDYVTEYNIPESGMKYASISVIDPPMRVVNKRESFILKKYIYSELDKLLPPKIPFTDKKNLDESELNANGYDIETFDKIDPVKVEFVKKTKEFIDKILSEPYFDNYQTYRKDSERVLTDSLFAIFPKHFFDIGIQIREVFETEKDCIAYTKDAANTDKFHSKNFVALMGRNYGVSSSSATVPISETAGKLTELVEESLKNKIKRKQVFDKRKEDCIKKGQDLSSLIKEQNAKEQ